MHGIHFRIVSSFVGLSFVCTASADKPKSESASTTTPAPFNPTKSDWPTDSPETRGRASLTSQLAALANDDAFIATFAKQATVLSPTGTNEVHANNAGIAAAVAFLNPHAEVTSAT